MPPSDKTVYLVSGANRGIGYGLVAALAARPDAIVFAGARDPAAKSLTDLAATHPNVRPVKLTAGDKADNEATIAEIRKSAGRLDVLFANAGISKHYGPLAAAPLADLRDHWEVNTLGLVVLFQAAHELLLASPTGAPVLAYISSAAGSIGSYLHLSASAYGSSKAAANFLVKVLDNEHPSLITMSINPGWVATDMGNAAAVVLGRPTAPVPVDASVKGILSRVDGATKEKSSGRFWNIKASGLPSEEIMW
ncbi:hypothetical protein B0H15DRAFT_411505 [Mycena belliarum]|uniref:NAD(P)-binding protein n=1 Tax=Mycena belliarum TaxID=1033014 RepID=A0AAD6XYD8_9AGAR|nr:hypothetical protein B0H15DRAFT_411505 [Mycena belliae]